MHVRFPFGTDVLRVDIPDGWVGNRVLRPRNVAPLEALESELGHALAQPMMAPPLEELIAQAKGAICLCLDGAGEPQAAASLLTALLRWMDLRQIARDSLSCLLAAPLPLTGEDIAGWARNLPADLWNGMRVEVHRPESAECAAQPPPGSGPAGAGSLRLNRVWSAAALRILVSVVKPDPLWGYTGGRAAVAPGLADEVGRKAMALDPERLSQPACRPGVLQNNPFHLLSMQAMRLAPPQFAIHLTANASGQVAGVFAGDAVQTHLAAVHDHRERLEPALAEPMDIVVTSGGGAPGDSTLLALIPSILSASRLLKPDGTLVVFSACAGGAGPEPFRAVLRSLESPQAYLEKAGRVGISSLEGALLHPLFHLLRAHEVLAHIPGVDEDDLWRMGFTPVPKAEEAISLAMESHGQQCKIAAVPDGKITLGRIN